MNAQLQTISQAVQRNCHIADASFATDFTLCVYLMKMREFYRWEIGHGFSDKLPNEEIGEWLRRREELWESLEQTEYQPITVNNEDYGPFETEEINQCLMPLGLVYSGGLGYHTKPHFFLGELEEYRQEEDYQILISNREYARDLSAPPAMSLGKTIFIRRESLRRMIWEKVEQWNWNRPDNPMARAIAMYDFKNDVESALDRITENELDNALLHEIGEVMAGNLLGSEWEEMLVSLPRSKVEMMLRAIRDHLADALSTLPRLVDSENEASIHFYLGNLTNLRKDLFPSLLNTYHDWLESKRDGPLRRLIAISRDHWLTVAQQALTIFQQGDPDWMTQVEHLIENRRL